MILADTSNKFPVRSRIYRQQQCVQGNACWTAGNALRIIICCQEAGHDIIVVKVPIDFKLARSISLSRGIIRDWNWSVWRKRQKVLWSGTDSQYSTPRIAWIANHIPIDFPAPDHYEKLKSLLEVKGYLKPYLRRSRRNGIWQQWQSINPKC